MSDARHWEKVYAEKPADQVGWYAPHLETSLHWIGELGLAPGAPIIDVGGGTSRLVDDLLDAGHRDITVLDLSARAIRLTQKRLGARRDAVTWLHGDITEVELPARHYRLWHDRAAFHFLVRPGERQRYRDALRGALQPDGFFIIGTFAPDAPPQCSGLPVERYSADRLAEFFGSQFEPKRQQNELHVTPSGVEQSYVYCLFQRSA